MKWSTLSEWGFKLPVLDWNLSTRIKTELNPSYSKFDYKSKN